MKCSLLLKEQDSESFNVEYETDYQNLTISIYPVDKQITARFKLRVDIDSLQDLEEEKGIFLIKSLADELMITDENTICLNFDISALHNKIYQERAALLSNYFNVNQQQKISKNNDQL